MGIFHIFQDGVVSHVDLFLVIFTKGFGKYMSMCFCSMRRGVYVKSRFYRGGYAKGGGLVMFRGVWVLLGRFE